MTGENEIICECVKNCLTSLLARRRLLPEDVDVPPPRPLFRNLGTVLTIAGLIRILSVSIFKSDYVINIIFKDKL